MPIRTAPKRRATEGGEIETHVGGHAASLDVHRGGCIARRQLPSGLCQAFVLWHIMRSATVRFLGHCDLSRRSPCRQPLALPPARRWPRNFKSRRCLHRRCPRDKLKPDTIAFSDHRNDPITDAKSGLIRFIEWAIRARDVTDERDAKRKYRCLRLRGRRGGCERSTCFIPRPLPSQAQGFPRRDFYPGATDQLGCSLTDFLLHSTR